ncbi:Hint domain-containing protein [Paracoccus sp. NSM]|uniref:Hint domain-containing protein n=1 Tax=Paracoccus sp. NSM TaxID=3457784 RepID=UPI004036AF72
MSLISNDVTVQNYNGSLASVSLLSPDSANLLLNRFGATTTTTVTDNNSQLIVGETVTLGDGRTATVLGSGTVQPGVRQLGITVPLGTRVPVVVLQSGNQLIFMYPEGAPNILGTVALIVSVSEVDYTFPGGPICFAADTLIETLLGLVPAASLQPGMSVLTRDNGFQEIVWVGSRYLSGNLLRAGEKMRPILIRQGALGPDMPSRDMIVSPQHRVLVNSRIILRLFDVSEALVAAKHLVGLPGIEEAPWEAGVTYTHFMCEKHEVVLSEGTFTESLYTGPEALKAVGSEGRAEILRIFPTLAVDGRATAPAAARKLLTGREGRGLAHRHVKNGVMLQQGA